MSMTILNVDGLDDPSCVDHVREILTMSGVDRVDVRADDGAVEIEHAPTVSSGRLIGVLALAGYEARPRS